MNKYVISWGLKNDPSSYCTKIIEGDIGDAEKEAFISKKFIYQSREERFTDFLSWEQLAEAYCLFNNIDVLPSTAEIDKAYEDMIDSKAFGVYAKI